MAGDVVQSIARELVPQRFVPVQPHHGIGERLCAVGNQYVESVAQVHADVNYHSVSIESGAQIDGKIAARTVVVGAEGRIAGSISAETVDLRGQLEGQISCAALTLRSVAHVHADVNYHNVTIESGAQIDGKFIRAKA